MKKKILFGSFIAVVILVLVSFAPSINANVTKASLDSELVEFTTEVCGLNGGKHTVSLSKEEAEEVEKLFDDIERRLDKVETREETIKIFNEAIVELDKYGLLGGLSIKQAQRFVTGIYQDSRILNFVEKVYNRYKNQIDGDISLFCLVASVITNIEFYGPGLIVPASIYFSTIYISALILLLGENFPYYFEWLFLLLASPFLFLHVLSEFGLVLFLLFSDYINPFPIGYSAYFPEEQTQKGWIWTNGINGNKIYEGVLKGTIEGIIAPSIGIVGFSGFKIALHGDNSGYFPDSIYYFLGFAPIVSVKEL